uniref:Nephrocystin 3-like N-terminal domain-containing protein n=1 Tax=Mycena chlorophos TaxID=658473 RepID=A0ABQ0L9S3_MYCCL|nr:predicted protein [Mycena chlorophos]
MSSAAAATQTRSDSTQLREQLIPVIGLVKDIAELVPTAGPYVGLALGAIKGLLEQVGTVKSNKEDLPKLKQQIEKVINLSLNGIEGDLRNRLEHLQSNIHPCLLKCDNLLDLSEKKRHFWKAKAIEKDIQTMRSDITQHIQSFMLSHNISLYQLIDTMKKDAEQDRLKDKQDAILQKLDKNVVNAGYNAEGTPDLCLEGTRVNIMDNIGSGKSTIAKTIATGLAMGKWNTCTLAASFFFSNKSPERATHKNLPVTLAHQLVQHNPEFKAKLAEFLIQTNCKALEEASQFQFISLVVNILAQIPESGLNWVICIDALDESGKEDRGKTVVRWILENIKTIPKHIKFFLTGRPDVPQNIQYGLQQSLAQEIKLDAYNEETVKADIQKYLEVSLSGDYWSNIERKPVIIQELVARSGKLFIYAATAVRYIKGSELFHDKAAKFLLSQSGGHVDLRELYFGVMTSFIPLPPQDHSDTGADQEYSDKLKILYVLLNLKELLSLENIAILLRMDVRQLHKYLALLSAVVSVPALHKKQELVQLYHLSFREFLYAENILKQKNRGDLHCNSTLAQNCIFEKVMNVLQGKGQISYSEPKPGLQFNMARLPSSYLRNSDMNVEDLVKRHIPGYLQYGCRYWIEHAIQSNTDAARSDVYTFLKSHGIFWLEGLSLIGQVGRMTLMLEQLAQWLKMREAKDLCREFLRLINVFGRCIQESTPHLYISALAFLPQTSGIRALSSLHHSRSFTLVKGLDRQWPQMILELRGHSETVTSVAFSPDGTHIASCSGDHTVRIWDAATGEALGSPLKGHGDWVTSVAFSPDETRIASGSYDCTVRIWDAATGEALGSPLEGHGALVTSVAFSPDGTHIASGSHDHTVQTWDAATHNDNQAHVCILFFSFQSKFSNFSFCSAEPQSIVSPLVDGSSPPTDHSSFGCLQPIVLDFALLKLPKSWDQKIF